MKAHSFSRTLRVRWILISTTYVTSRLISPDTTKNRLTFWRLHIFLQPLPDTSNAGRTTGDEGAVDETVVQSLVASLGAFTADQVRAALNETSGVADRAADWLFSHMDDLDSAIAALRSKASGGTLTGSGSRNIALEDAVEGKYTLMGMISHIGKNTGSGHYVAHLKKGGKWMIFNDEKVALSSKPPFQHAYLYLFQRSDTIQSSAIPN